MSTQVLRAAALLYAAGAAAYLLAFARPRHALAPRLGAWLVLGGFVAQTVSIGLGCKELGGAEFFNLRGGFGMMGWLAAGVYLVLARRARLPSVGAFVLPVVLLSVLPGVFGLGPEAQAAVPAAVRRPALVVHVSAALGGVALFGIACSAALMYLLQERELKGKRFGALFSRLPSLDALDRLNQRLVRLGFGVWTVALVTGAVVAKHAWGSFWAWDPQQVASLAIWLLYGLMVQLRRSGFRGRSYALLTVAGFALVLGSRAAMLAVPYLTRHGGTFQ